MEERRDHLTVVIGAAGIAEDLRRLLVRANLSHVGIATHLRGLRKSMIVERGDLVVVCIALDHPTLARHGNALRRLLADHECYPRAVRSVGLLTDIGLTRDAAEMGCDVYVDNSAQAADAVRMLARRWQRLHSRKPVVAAKKRSASSMARHERGSPKPDGGRVKSWTWGINEIPVE